MYECFNCRQKAVIWDNDFMFEDYGMEGNGIVHVCHCTNCEAQIMYYVPIEKVEENNEVSSRFDGIRSDKVPSRRRGC